MIIGAISIAIVLIIVFGALASPSIDRTLTLIANTIIDEARLAKQHLSITEGHSTELTDLTKRIDRLEGAVSNVIDQLDHEDAGLEIAVRRLAAATAGLQVLRPRKRLADVMATGDNLDQELWLARLEAEGN